MTAEEIKQTLLSSKRYPFLTDKSFLAQGYHFKIYVPQTLDRAEFLRDIAQLLDAEYRPKCTSPKSNKGVVITKWHKIVAKPVPGGDRSVRLKPQDLGIAGKEYTPVELAALIKDRVKAKLDNQELAEFLIEMVDYAHTGKRIARVPDSLPILEIKHDFSELLGPLALVRDNVFPNVERIFHPSNGAERLLDYLLIAPDRKYKVSAKGGSCNSNTVSPKDVLALIDSDPDKAKRWLGTLQYELTRALAYGTCRGGPFDAARLLGSKGVLMFQGHSDLTTWEQFVPYIEPWIGNDTNRAMTRDENFVRFYLEKMITHYSKHELDVKSFFLDAVMDNVFYVKFILGINQGEVDMNFKLIDTQDFQGRSVYFRSKQSCRQRAKDKMGFAAL